MEKYQPLVSIVMPNYNSGDYIKDSITSVINQTYKNWELLIVDDCSTDQSIEIIREYVKKDNRIKLIINDKNVGAAISRNKAIELAQGEYIAFLDSDDRWINTKLEKQLNFMINNNIAFSYTHYFINNVNSKIIRSPKHINYKKLLKYDQIGCLTVMYNVKKVGKVQILDIKKRNDYALWLKILRRVDGYLLDEPLAIYTKRRNSLSSNKIKLLKYHYIVFRRSENYNVLLSILFTIRNVIYYLILKLQRKK